MINSLSFQTQVHKNFSLNRVYSLLFISLMPTLILIIFRNPSFLGKISTLFLSFIVQDLMFILFLKESPICLIRSCLNGVILIFLLPFSLPWIAFIITPLFINMLNRTSFNFSNYWISPTLLGFLFAFLNWPQSWTQLFSLEDSPSLINSYLNNNPKSEIDIYISNIINNSFLFSKLAINIPEGYIGLLKGSHIYNYVSPLGLFLAIVIVWKSEIIKWIISVSYLLSFFSLIYIFEGWFVWEDRLFRGDMLFYFLSPPIILAVFFLSTECQTSPLFLIEQSIYGLICGFLSFLCILLWPSPYSALFGIILAQTLSPLFEVYDILYLIRRRKIEKFLPFFFNQSKTKKIKNKEIS